jgi:hypothetical protein
MDQSEPAQHPPAKGVIVKFGDHEPAFAADDYKCRLTGTVKQDSDLPPDIKGEFKQMAR